MRHVRIASWMLITALAAGLQTADVAAEGRGEEEQPASGTTGREQAEKATEQQSDIREHSPLTTAGPRYSRPPGPGALVSITVIFYPRGARECLPSGSAGTGSESPTLAVLAPADHVGLTIDEQPSLYWYLSGAVTCPIAVTLIDEQTVQPLLEITLSPPVSPGVQRLRLADHNLHLLPGVHYKWSVALVPDPNERSKDLITGTAIERIEPTDPLRAQLAQADTATLPTLYAEAGLWYDALTALSDLIEGAPDDAVLRQQRTSLLGQVGLRDIVR